MKSSDIIIKVIPIQFATKTIALCLLLFTSVQSIYAQGSPQLTIGPLTLNFGDNQVGSSCQASFFVQHIVGSPPASGTVTIDNPAFTIASGSMFSLSGGDVDTVQVLFTPSAVASYSGTASVSSSATFSGANQVTLNGNGTQPPPTIGAVMVNVQVDGVP